MALNIPSRNGLRERGEHGMSRPGRHARPVSPPAGVLADVLRDRSLDRIKAADRAVADAQARLRSTGADSDAINGAFAVVRDSLNEARETVREAGRELALVLNEWEQLSRRLDSPGRYPEAPAPVVPDPPDVNLCPDPGAARTPPDFMVTLREYRKWAGEPSYRAMEHVIKMQRGQRFAASTIHAALKGEELPSLQKVQAIVGACGGSESDQQRFTTAWRRLAMSKGDARQDEVTAPGPGDGAS